MIAPRVRAPRPSNSSASARRSDTAAGKPSAAPKSDGPLLHGEAPIDPSAREVLIREAAYYQAERRGFQPGHELEDWLTAEREFDQWLATRAAPRRYAR